MNEFERRGREQKAAQLVAACMKHARSEGLDRTELLRLAVFGDDAWWRARCDEAGVRKLPSAITRKLVTDQLHNAALPAQPATGGNPG